MTKYRIYFVNNLYVDADLAEYQKLMQSAEDTTAPGVRWNDTADMPYFNFTHITHVVRFESLEGSGGVAKPKTPEDIKKAKEEELANSISSADNVLEKAKKELKKDELPTE